MMYDSPAERNGTVAEARGEGAHTFVRVRGAGESVISFSGRGGRGEERGVRVAHGRAEIREN